MNQGRTVIAENRRSARRGLRAARAARRGLCAAALVLSGVCGIDGATPAWGQSAQPRVDLTMAAPLARCKLQPLPAASAPSNAPAIYHVTPTPEIEALANYERSSLGDWRMPSDVDRNDPWVRLLLAGRDRPLLIDIAIMIDGQPFRAAREAWIDELLADSRGDDESNVAPAREPAASEGASTQPPSETAEAPGTAVPNVQPKARTKRTIRERLLSYLAAAGADVRRQEIRWLTAAWGSGPELLVLGPSLSWQRAGVAPVLIALDQDGDDALSTAEIEGAASRLRLADKDQNDIVTVDELKQLTNRPYAWLAAVGHPLVSVIDRDADWETLAAMASRVYGRERAAFAEADRLLAAPADVTLRVDLATRDASAGGVSLLAVNHEIAKSERAVRAADDTITVEWDAHVIEFSAAQPAGETDPLAATQASIGAVIDGNPLLRVLDLDQDGRLTSRERQDLGALLNSLDRNGDAQLAAREVPVPIRVAVTLGPRVHEVLASARSAASAFRPHETRAPPEWFVSMDRNGDRDVSRAEFLGTSEQFALLDVDGDGLLSVAEALALDEAKQRDAQD